MRMDKVARVAAMLTCIAGCDRPGLTELSPQINVKPMAVDFGPTLVGSSGVQTVEVQNLGQKALALEPSTSSNAEFEGPAGNANISPGGKLLINIAFSPSQEGMRDGVIHLLSNAGNDADVEVAVTGIGITSAAGGGSGGGQGATGGGNGAGGGAGDSGCSPMAGQSCTKSWREETPGCDENYGCASFWGVYYESPNGCDAASASSSVEHPSGGCTYIGFASYDPFKGVADGQCHLAVGYSIANTYTKVIPSTGCTYSAIKHGPGIYDCSGNCQ